MTTAHEKLYVLQDIIARYGKMAVAFSAGVDSTFLLSVARDVLGNDAIAITAKSDLFPDRELKNAVDFCQANHVHQIVFDAHVFDIDGFAQNPPDRCYRCKRALFSQMLRLAEQEGFSVLAEGSNTDDEGDYRPGMKAICELHIQSPLRQANLSKNEIRFLSEEKGLPTWNKPSFACLASRFVYGETITKEKLKAVEKAERFLMGLGLKQLRVRVHENMARIEVLPSDFEKLISEGMAERIHAYLSDLGFMYVSLDLGGYQTGSMNKTIFKK